ncbi:hypothetical protein LPJ71_001303 [Coemansia sp. S17]|nr:hypothetical protein LPJ71_001303 [Coemansia sp. S17]KAJ2425504.1 hypothetical protein GGF41_002397 [Coemansia sp. RSA 2531]
MPTIKVEAYTDPNLFKYDIQVDSLDDTFASVMTKLNEKNEHFSAVDHTFAIGQGLEGKRVRLTDKLSSKNLKDGDTIYTFPDLEIDRQSNMFIAMVEPVLEKC